MISHCEGLGLQPNLKRGKTSILLRLAGKGAQAAKRAAFPKGEPRLHLRDLDVNVEIVANYTHLGGVLDHRGRMDQEARRRIAVAATAYDAGKQVLFGNRTIDLEARTAVFEATVRPTIFNLCLWVPGGSAWEKLNIGYTGLVRRLLQPTLQTKDVFKIPGPLAHILTGTPPLWLYARKARLSFLLSLVCHGPPSLWAMLQAQQGWTRCVREDLVWLASFPELEWPLPCAAAWSEWWHHIRTAPAISSGGCRSAL